MVLTEAAGDAKLVLWDGREFGHSGEAHEYLTLSCIHDGTLTLVKDPSLPTKNSSASICLL